MNKRRLLKLAEFLETAKLPGNFDMGKWADDIDGKTPACGTSACAMGWATTIPSFRRAGLHLGLNSWDDAGLRFGRTREFSAAAAFFQITIDQSRDLFHPWHYTNKDGTDIDLAGKRGRRIVAKRIRRLVETGSVS